LKELIDQIFTNPNTSEEFVTKTLFLYYFELMGIAEKDSLEYMCSFIAKNSDEKKLHSLFEDDVFEISFDKLVFFSHDKKSLLQKKLLKKFSKIFIANVVDGLP
jgi:hypothetical protein